MTSLEFKQHLLDANIEEKKKYSRKGYPYHSIKNNLKNIEEVMCLILMKQPPERVQETADSMRSVLVDIISRFPRGEIAIRIGEEKRMSETEKIPERTPQEEKACPACGVVGGHDRDCGTTFYEGQNIPAE